MDPKMRALVDYLRANYRRAGATGVGQPRIERRVPSESGPLPVVLERRVPALVLARHLRSGSGGRTTTSMNPIED